jgi:fructosamine-3-kinase
VTIVDFRKERPDAPPGLFACEAIGLRWLAVPGGPRVVRVLAVDVDGLDLERLEPAEPTAAAARELGAGLAVLHDAGAAAFGVTPDGWGDDDGFFGPLEAPLPLFAGRYERWGEFYADCRITQVRDLMTQHGLLSSSVRDDLERVADRLRAGEWDDDERPARLHGDLWSGNVVWTAEHAVLIDPAAHGGHQLTDLAMLELFGLPYLDEVLAAYQEAHPLRSDWRDLVGLHQIYPVGMHAVLFGGAYVDQLAGLARQYA